MIVKLAEHIGRNVATGEQVRCPQYLIMVDNKHCGFLPFHEGARPLLFVKFGPIELCDIERQIRDLLPEGHTIKNARTAPEPPADKEDVVDDAHPFSAFENWIPED